MDTPVPPNPWEKKKEEVLEEKSEVVVKPEYLTDEKVEPVLDKKALIKKKVTKIIFILAPFVLVLLIISVVAMAMGWDKGVFKSSVTGYVYDSKSTPIKSANVTIEGKKAVTDESGMYRIEGLEYGPNKVTVKAEDYEDLSAEVTLSRGENKDRNFTLEFISYSYIQGKLLFNDTSIDPATFKLMIGNLELSVDNQGEFKSGKLDVGTFKLVLTSSIYKDYNQDVLLVAGKNIAPDIALVSAKDVTISTINFLSGAKVTDVTLKYQSQNYKSDANGTYVLLDFVAEGDLGLKAEKTGFLPKSATLANVGNGLSVELVPTGRIYYTSNRDGKDNIYSSNYDGSEEKKLTDGKGSVTAMEMASNGDIYFYSDREKVTGDSAYEQLYTVPINGGSIKRFGDIKNVYGYNQSSNSQEVFPLTNKIVTSGYTYIEAVPPFNANPINRVRITIKNISGDVNEKVLLDEPQRPSEFVFVNSAGNPSVSSDGKKVTYTYNYCEPTGCYEKIFIQNTDGTNKKEILNQKNSDGYITNVKGFSLNAKYLVYSVYDNKDNSESIYSYNLNSGKVNKFSNTNFSYWDGRLGNDENYIYYRGDRDSKSDIYRVNLENGTVEKLTNSGKVVNFMVLGKDILLSQITKDSENKLEIQAVGNLNSKNIPVSTTFRMWQTNYYYYGYGD